jgi:hypothetical protein
MSKARMENEASYMTPSIYEYVADDEDILRAYRY